MTSFTFSLFRARLVTGLVTAVILCTATCARAQEAKKKALAICEISPTPALAERSIKVGTKNELDRVIQSFDAQLVDRMHNTRKYTIQAHSDLPDLIKSGRFNAQALRGTDILVATVDDFADIDPVKNKDNVLLGGENRVVFRNIRVSIVAKIYKGGSDELRESANFTRTIGATQQDQQLGDALLVKSARELSELVANRVAYVIDPPKVVDVSTVDDGNNKQIKQVTVNWGDGLFIAPGDTWEVVARKFKTVDGEDIPIDTVVGTIEIQQVEPKASVGKVVGDEKPPGITDKECFLRNRKPKK